MSPPPDQPRDPIRWCAGIALAFMGLCLIRLDIPTKLYFDEIHYVPAARALLDMSKLLNREHPMVGKEIIALGIALFGDNHWGWRVMPLLAGTTTIFASMRALWFASLSRFATLAYGLLMASGFMVFVHARIAMLDGFMLCFTTIAAWQFAAACREPERGRRRLAATGIALGLAIGSKWTMLPLAVLPGLTFFVARLMAGRRRLLTSRRGAPVPGISLVEAFVWLGLLPLAVYTLTYLPGYLIMPGDFAQRGFVGLHEMMVRMQESVVKPHPYMSHWPQWVLDTRSIWYLYEYIDGAQRGIVLIGNPLTMILGLPALVWALWAGVRGNRAALGASVGYIAAIGLWVIAPKPVQFYYHYLPASCFLLAALALSLDALRKRGWRKLTTGFVIASLAVFGWFYPILSAAPLEGKQSFALWMWTADWR